MLILIERFPIGTPLFDVLMLPRCGKVILYFLRIFEIIITELERSHAYFQKIEIYMIYDMNMFNERMIMNDMY